MFFYFNEWTVWRGLHRHSCATAAACSPGVGIPRAGNDGGKYVAYVVACSRYISTMFPLGSVQWCSLLFNPT